MSSPRLSADLLSLGTHCALPDCQQIDFLPFHCGACDQVFCLEHRTCEAHSCPKARDQDASVIICPLCAKAIKMTGQQDPNAAFEQHTLRDCEPDNYAKVHKKKKCPVEGCKEKLTSTNTFVCKTCHSEICLKHRFPSDHKCQERQAQMAQSKQGSKARGLLHWGAALQSSLKKNTPVERTPKSSNTVPLKMKQQPVPASQPLGTQALRTSQPASGAPEVCPQCGERLASVAELIQHVDVVHLAGGQAALQSRTQLERCPHCSSTFPDAVSLVQHVERQHASSPACVLS